VVNLSSAAQSPVNLEALAGRAGIPDQFNAYSQSKLALTMWSRAMADAQKNNGLVIVAVNPGSLLATKMVKEGFGTAGNDIRIGADILVSAALSDEFAAASGLYFDNDKGQFAPPHPDALDRQKCEDVVAVIEALLEKTEQSDKGQA
jgi:NAD(P)-dependent dehydrogenase (short-subunit alcohol dehydrogenase family)